MKPKSAKPGRQEGSPRLPPERALQVGADESGWATATRRVLLYLKALGIPPRDSLTLAQKALDCAEREPGSPAAETALIALRSLLLERDAYGSGSLPWWPSEGTAKSPPPMAVPRLNPGQMAPARIDRRPWLTFLLRCTRRCTSFLWKDRKGRKTGKKRRLPPASSGSQAKEEMCSAS